MPEPSLSPQAFCRRLLTALRHRLQPDHELSYLAMLLTYFIDLAPSPDAFARQLAQYVADARPGIVEAAAAIQAAWERNQQQALPPVLPLHEALRTVGARLDAEQAALATLDVEPTAITVRLFGQLQEYYLDAVALQDESGARQALRGHVPGPGAPAPERYETQLRVVGTLLEAEPPQGYIVVVAPQLIGVEGSAGYFRLIPLAELTTRAYSDQRRRHASGGD